MEWESRALVADKNDAWITPAEESGFRLTPSYDETIAWLRKLVAAAPQLKMISLGKSPEGRDRTKTHALERSKTIGKIEEAMSLFFSSHRIEFPAFIQKRSSFVEPPETILG